MKGVALKIQNNGAIVGADIINTHFKKERQNGRVYYSTNVPFDKRRKIEKILFFFNHKGKLRYVIGDIIRYEFNNNPFIPNDSSKYSPEEYANVEKKSWFLIKGMKEVDNTFLEKCFVEYSTGESKKLIEIINHESRINRVYFNKISETMEDDVLIK